MKEKLAELAHQQWSGWMEYFFSKCMIHDDGTATIPKWTVERWKLQLKTSYLDLSEQEKDSDRNEAQRMISVIKMVD